MRWFRADRRQLCVFILSMQLTAYLPKLRWESALKERSSGWIRLYHDRPLISSAEYPKKSKTLSKETQKCSLVSSAGTFLNSHYPFKVNVPVWQMSKAHIQFVVTAEAATQAWIIVRNSVDCGCTEGHEQRLVGGTGWRGEQARLRERPEATCDQYWAAAVLQLEGLGGLHTTNKTPVWRETTRRQQPNICISHFHFIWDGKVHFFQLRLDACGCN